MTLPFKMRQETELEKWRAATWKSKEPETIEWIRSFSDGDIFIDVGANVGIYSLYCASIFPKMPILAIEPMKINFKRLEENKQLNGFHNMICFPLAISDKNKMCKLDTPNVTAGASGLQIQIGIEDIALSLDTIMNFDYSVHIKIDIDGQELNVIQGIGKKKWPQIKSTLIEVNDNKKEIIEIFAEQGFTTDNRFNTMTPHSRERRQREGITAENIIFTRV